MSEQGTAGLRVVVFRVGDPPRSGYALSFGPRDIANVAFLADATCGTVRLEERGPGWWRVIVNGRGTDAVRAALRENAPIGVIESVVEAADAG